LKNDERAPCSIFIRAAGERGKMTGKKIIVLFLIAGVLLAGSAMAEGNPDQVTGPGDSGQVSGKGDVTIQTDAPIAEPVDGSKYEDGALTREEALAEPEVLPDGGTAPEAEILPEEDTPPEGEVAPEAEGAPETEAALEETQAEDGAEDVTIADPIEPWNRLMFNFNDKLYFWALKPVARGYNAVVPEPVRVSVRDFFRNVAMPVRFVNSLFQGKVKGAGTELARFGINTTVGLAGFFDVAKSWFDLKASEEDLGQTFGSYGMGGMMYIVWPFLGPSTVRDTIGYAGDSFLDVANYINPFYIPMSIHAYDQINKTSLDLGTYEDLKESALEPYTAFRDAYIQYRNGQIKK
jgi:phospholipid-binding lipoprotein MlaA